MCGIDARVDDRNDHAGARRERTALGQANRVDRRLGQVVVPHLNAGKVDERRIAEGIQDGHWCVIERNAGRNLGHDGEGIGLDVDDFGVRADRGHQRLGHRHAGVADEAVGGDALGPDEEHVVGRDVEGAQDGQAMARRDLLDAVRRRVQQELIRRTGIRRDETQRRHTDGLRGLRDAGLLCEGNQRETEERWKHPRQASWFWGTRKLRRHPEPPNTPSEGFVDLSTGIPSVVGPRPTTVHRKHRLSSEPVRLRKDGRRAGSDLDGQIAQGRDYPNWTIFLRKFYAEMSAI